MTSLASRRGFFGGGGGGGGRGARERTPPELQHWFESSGGTCLHSLSQGTG